MDYSVSDEEILKEENRDELFRLFAPYIIFYIIKELEEEVHILRGF